MGKAIGEAQPAARWAELIEPGFRAATATLTLGTMLYAFNAFLVSTALPSAVSELGGVDLISWAFILYLVAAIVGGVISAPLKARLGARRAMAAAGMVFLAGTLAAGLAPSMIPLLVGRLLQGLGEGVIAALCYALIPALFPPRLVPKVFGLEALGWALAAFGGPVIAGALTESISWRAAFLVNVPMALIFIALVPLAVPESAERAGPGEAVPLLRVLGTAAGILALASASLFPDHLPWVVVAIVSAAAILALVVALDARCPVRLFPDRAFSLGTTVGAGLWVVLLMPVAEGPISVYLVLLVQKTLGLGPTLAGLFGATLAMAWSLTGLAITSIASGAGRLRLLRCGPLCLALGLVGGGFALFHGAALLVLLSQAVVGVGFGLSWAPLAQAVMDGAAEGDRDRAAALVPTVQTVGFALGAAIAGLIANAAGLTDVGDLAAVRAGLPWLFGVAALIALGAFGASLKLRA